jgi:Na+/melibiose symporter-like transporter
MWAGMAACVLLAVLWVVRVSAASGNEFVAVATAVLTAAFLALYVPFTLFAAVVDVARWLDRRRCRPGHCSCGYDLAGLAPGAACPECGKAGS